MSRDNNANLERPAPPPPDTSATDARPSPGMFDAVRARVGQDIHAARDRIAGRDESSSTGFQETVSNQVEKVGPKAAHFTAAAIIITGVGASGVADAQHATKQVETAALGQKALGDISTPPAKPSAADTWSEVGKKVEDLVDLDHKARNPSVGDS